MKDMRVSLGRLNLKNPIISPAGPVAGNAVNIRKCADAGFGAVICKTTSYFKDFQRYPRPRYYLFDHHETLREPHSHRGREYSWMHLDRNSQYPPDKFVEFVRETADYCARRDCVLIGSVAGAGIDQWVQMVKSYEAAGAKAMELNFCCPYPQTMPEVSRGDEHQIGSTFGENPDLGIPVIQAIRAVSDIPLFPKLPPSTRKQVGELTRKFIAAGADGVSFYANATALKIDIETAQPLGYGVAIGGSHGHMMDSLADVAKVSLELPGVPIIGGRGARYWTDVIEFLMAGASVVGFSIATQVNGLGYVGEMLADIHRWLERKGYQRLADVQGLALPKMLKTTEIRHKVKALVAAVDPKRCVACGRCEDVCWFNAAQLHVKQGRGAAKITRGHCVGCTACAQVCPAGCINLEERSDQDYLKALVSQRPDLVPDILDSL